MKMMMIMMVMMFRPFLLLLWMVMMMIPASTTAAAASSSSVQLPTQPQTTQTQPEPLFHVQSGPVVTVTLQEGKNGDATSANKWINLAALCPNIHWSVVSRRQPFRRWLPSLQSLQGVVGYQYNHHNHPRTSTTTDTILLPPRRRPDLLDITASFQTPYGQVDVVPQLGSTAGSQPRLLLQWTHPGTGGGSILALFQKTSLKLLKGCYQWNFMSSSSSSEHGSSHHNTNNMNTMGLEAIRLTPSYSFAHHQPSLLMEATTTSQRTKTILNLQANHPTLTVVHALNDR